METPLHRQKLELAQQGRAFRPLEPILVQLRPALQVLLKQWVKEFLVGILVQQLERAYRLLWAERLWARPPINKLLLVKFKTCCRVHKLVQQNSVCFKLLDEDHQLRSKGFYKLLEDQLHRRLKLLVSLDNRRCKLVREESRTLSKRCNNKPCSN